MVDLAVVVVSWNVRDLLRACLESLVRDLEAAGLRASLHVVDNASADGSPGMVASRFPEAQLTANEVNVGFASANNQAMRDALQPDSTSCPYIWLLNPDTEVVTGATQALLSCLEERPTVGIVGAKLLNPDGSLQHGAFRFPGLMQLGFELFRLPPRLYETGLNGRYPPRQYAGSSPFQVGHPLGASMMVRSETIAQVGLMDEGYHMYCEEIDWCWRMKRAGWQAMCAPAASIVHHAGKSSSQVPVASFENLWRSRARLYRRMLGPARFAVARQMVEVGMRRRARSSQPEMTAACARVIDAWRGPH